MTVQTLAQADTGAAGGAVAMPGDRWYVFLTAPASWSADVAQRHLRSQGFQFFFPRALVRREDGSDKIEPYFGGYRFVLFDISDPGWGRLAHTRGVSRLIVRGDGRPVPVPVGFVEGLMSRASLQGIVDLREVVPSIPLGASVKITEGPFVDFQGTCGGTVDDRVRVLLDLFGRKTPVEVARGHVRVV